MFRVCAIEAYLLMTKMKKTSKIEHNGNFLRNSLTSMAIVAVLKSSVANVDRELTIRKAK